jgi:hypothetical protein
VSSLTPLDLAAVVKNERELKEMMEVLGMGAAAPASALSTCAAMLAVVIRQRKKLRWVAGRARDCIAWWPKDDVPRCLSLVREMLRVVEDCTQLPPGRADPILAVLEVLESSLERRGRDPVKDPARLRLVSRLANRAAWF